MRRPSIPLLAAPLLLTFNVGGCNDSKDDDDGTSGSASGGDDGGDGGAIELENCIDWHLKWAECDGYDVAEYEEYAQEYCEDYADEYAAFAGCLPAWNNYFECALQLTCDQLEAEIMCATEWQQIEAACPDAGE